MNALGFRPSRKFLHKRILLTLLTGSLTLSLSLLTGSWIGEELGGTELAVMGRLIALAMNLGWMIPCLSLLYPSYRSLFYEIHVNEVVLHTGIFTRRVTHIPFHRISNIQLHRDPLDRALGLGTINIQTPGTSDHSGATKSLKGLQNYREIYDRLTSAIQQS